MTIEAGGVLVGWREQVDLGSKVDDAAVPEAEEAAALDGAVVVGAAAEPPNAVPAVDTELELEVEPEPEPEPRVMTVVAVVAAWVPACV